MSRIWKQPEPQSQHYTIGICKLNFAKLEKLFDRTIPNSYTEQSPEKNYWALKKAEGHIEYMFKLDGADAAVVLEIWIRILTKDTTQSLTHNKQRTVAYFNYIMHIYI
jgi:hypothetical protein